MKKLPGLTKYEVSDGPIASPFGSAEAHRIAIVHFVDLATLRNAIAIYCSPPGLELGAVDTDQKN